MVLKKFEGEQMVFKRKSVPLEPDQQEELRAIIERLRRCYSIATIANMFPVSSVTVYKWLGLEGGSLKRLNQARGFMCEETDSKREQLKENEDV